MNARTRLIFFFLFRVEDGQYFGASFALVEMSTADASDRCFTRARGSSAEFPFASVM